VDQTLKGIQNSKDQKFLQSIDENPMEETMMKIQKIKKKQRPLGLIRQKYWKKP
jgi:hypothetical protein